MTDDGVPRWPRVAGSGPVVALGKLVVDQLLVLSGRLVVGGQQRVSLGGAPANVTAQLARLGVPCRLAGWAGRMPWPPNCSTRWSYGASRCGRCAAGKCRSPRCSCTRTANGRCSPLAESGGLQVSDVDARWVADAAVLHLDGFDLLRFPPALMAAASLARAAGMPVSVDVAAAARIERFGVAPYLDLLGELRPDVLFCNAAEASVLGLPGALPAWAPSLVLVQAGASPTRVLTRLGEWSVPVEPLPSERLRGTTGCGDAVAAGVLAGWRAGSPVLDAVRGGHAAAAVVAGVLGAQPPP